MSSSSTENSLLISVTNRRDKPIKTKQLNNYKKKKKNDFFRISKVISQNFNAMEDVRMENDDKLREITSLISNHILNYWKAMNSLTFLIQKSQSEDDIRRENEEVKNQLLSKALSFSTLICDKMQSWDSGMDDKMIYINDFNQRNNENEKLKITNYESITYPWIDNVKNEFRIIKDSVDDNVTEIISDPAEMILNCDKSRFTLISKDDISNGTSYKHNYEIPEIKKLRNSTSNSKVKNPRHNIKKKKINLNTKACSLLSRNEMCSIMSSAQDIISEINLSEYLKPVQGLCPIPFLLRAKLRKYQHEGITWLLSLHDANANGILADEMGLGKTLQTIGLLAYLACYRGIWGPHLIVVPSSVVMNWEAEFRRFFPGFKVLTYYGGKKERDRKRQGWNNPYSFNVCIASYTIVAVDSHIFKRKPWYYFVLDEAQHIKNHNSQKWQVMVNFNSKRRVLLTGTPLQNDLMELWSLMYFLMPTLFESLTDWKQIFSDPISRAIEDSLGEKKYKLVAKLHTILRPFLLRRLKKDVECQMPSKYEHVVKCFLTQRQKVLYNEFIQNKVTQETIRSSDYFSLLNILMQLRKICNHPDLILPREVSLQFEDKMSDSISIVVPSLVNIGTSQPWTRTKKQIHQYMNLSSHLYSIILDEFRVSNLNGLFILGRDAIPSYTQSNVNGVYLKSTRNNCFGSYGINNQLNCFNNIEKEKEYLSRDSILENHGLESLLSGSPYNLCQNYPCFSCMNLDKFTNKLIMSSLTYQPKMYSVKETTTPKSLIDSKTQSVIQNLLSLGDNLSNIYFYPCSLRKAIIQYLFDAKKTILDHHSIMKCFYGSNFPGQLQNKHQYAIQVSALSGILLGSPFSDLCSYFELIQNMDFWFYSVSSRVRKEIRATSSSTVSESIKNCLQDVSTEILQNYFHTLDLSLRTSVKSKNSIDFLDSMPLNFVWTSCIITGLKIFNKFFSLDYFKKTLPQELNYIKCSTSIDTNNKCSIKQFIKYQRTLLGFHFRSYLQSITWSSSEFVRNVPIQSSKERIYYSVEKYFQSSTILDNLLSIGSTYIDIKKKILSELVCVHPLKVYSNGAKIYYRGVHGIMYKYSDINAIQKFDKLFNESLSSFTKNMNLMQTCILPSRKSIQNDSGKFIVLAELLRVLKRNGHKCVIFTQMFRMLDILEIFMNIHYFSYVRLDGSTKLKDRQKLVELFNNDPRIFIFMASTRAGGLGINLVGADRVIFFDSDWNPAIDRQAMDRCHRIGQRKDVHIYRFITESTIEENIFRKQLMKRVLDDLIVDQGKFTTQNVSASLNQDDVEKIFTTNIDTSDLYVTRVLHESSSTNSFSEIPKMYVTDSERRFEEALCEVEKKEFYEVGHISVDETKYSSDDSYDSDSMSSFCGSYLTSDSIDNKDCRSYFHEIFDLPKSEFENLKKYIINTDLLPQNKVKLPLNARKFLSVSKTIPYGIHFINFFFNRSSGKA